MNSATILTGLCLSYTDVVAVSLISQTGWVFVIKLSRLPLKQFERFSYEHECALTKQCTPPQHKAPAAASGGAAACGATCAPPAASWSGTPPPGRATAPARPAARSAAPPTASRKLRDKDTVQFLVYNTITVLFQSL